MQMHSIPEEWGPCGPMRETREVPGDQQQRPSQGARSAGPWTAHFSGRRGGDAGKLTAERRAPVGVGCLACLPGSLSSALLREVRGAVGSRKLPPLWRVTLHVVGWAMVPGFWSATGSAVAMKEFFRCG